MQVSAEVFVGAGLYTPLAEKALNTVVLRIQ